MGAASGVTSAVDMGLGMWSQGQETGAEMADNAAKQDAAQSNAMIARQAAQSALQRGRQQEMQSRLKYGAVAGQQKANYGASGVVATSGSAIDTIANTEAMSDYDAAVIRNNAAREAWGYRAQEKQYEQQGKLLAKQRDDIDTSGKIKIGTGLLKGMTSIAGDYAKYDKKKTE